MEQKYPTREQAKTMNGCESCEACMANGAANFCHWPGEAFVAVHDELDRRQAEIDSRADSMILLGRMADEQISQICEARDLVRRMAAWMDKQICAHYSFKFGDQTAPDAQNLMREAEAMTKGEQPNGQD